MIICVAGKNNIAVDVLEHLININNDRYDLCVLCNSIRKELIGFQKSLSRTAQNNGIPEIDLEDTYNMDNLIFLSMEYDRIVSPAKFKDARLYNIHFSYLPQYKGMYTSAIPILNGEKWTGVTLHEIDSGIDTGDIIAQRKIFIEDGDTCRDLYKKYIDIGTKLVNESIEMIISGKYKGIKQLAKNASFYPGNYIDYHNLKLNMNDVAESVERQVRAYSFREYQMPRFNECNIIACKITDNRSSCKAGNLVSEDESTFVVSTIDYDVILYKDRYEDMFAACKSGNLETVKKICCCIEHIRIEDKMGNTPIMVAAACGNENIVEYIDGLKVNKKDEYR